MAELVCAATDPRWLAERRKGVTATDITAILGLSPYQSPFGLWWEKTGPDMPAHEDSDRLRLGRELEPYIRTRWAESCDEALFGTREGLFRNSDRPWAVTIWTSGCISLIMPNTYLNRPEDDRPHRYSPRSGALTGTAGRLDS